ncbi:MAG: aldo/keto reductase [Chitinophagaceae bacterium]
MALRDRLSFGCVALTTFRFQSEALQILNLAFENGITSFDTAPLYGKGYSEKILGAFIKDKRNNVVVTTKVGLGLTDYRTIPTIIALPLNSIKTKLTKKKVIDEFVSLEKPTPLTLRKIDKLYIERSIQKSLKRLQTSYIDNFFLHEAMPGFLTDEALFFLLQLKARGLVKNLGIASGAVNYDNLDSSSVKGMDVLQYEYNWFQRTEVLQNEFPGFTHNFHSVFKPLHFVKKDKSSIYRLPGYLLCEAVRQNKTNGKVLFSTSKEERLLSNLKYFDDAFLLNASQLNEEIQSLFEN